MAKKNNSSSTESGSSGTPGHVKMTRILVHLTGAVMFSFGVYYFFCQIHFPKRPGVEKDFAGKMKFLTTLNAVLQHSTLEFEPAVSAEWLSICAIINSLYLSLLLSIIDSPGGLLHNLLGQRFDWHEWGVAPETITGDSTTERLHVRCSCTAGRLERGKYLLVVDGHRPGVGVP